MPTPPFHDRSGKLWIEPGEQREGTIAEVAPLIPLHKSYSFAVPDEIAPTVAVGQRVLVPLGRRGRLVKGFIVGLDRGAWDSTLRPIHSLIDETSFLTPHLMALGREISVHYVCPLGRTLKSITPDAVRLGRGLKQVRYVRAARTLEELEHAAERVTPQRNAVMAVLQTRREPMRVDELVKTAGVSASILRGLEKIGWIEVLVRKESPADESAPAVLQVEPAFELNAEQRAALNAVEESLAASRFSVTLLYGVSGSGKTEVYVHAMRRVIAGGKQAILLVPEIVLTTQLVERLSSRFANVALMHSALIETQRAAMWRDIAAGRRPVIIGTRSAVFAPCPNLGLICVDEEQEGSYKNLQAPRFHVRDVAIMRAKLLDIPIVLGSATPSVETWFHSEHRPDYRRVMIRRRVRELPMPKVHVVDMRDEFAEAKRAVVFSRTMERLLGETLARGEQAILLMNRRGFAHRIVCPACGTRVSCPNCNVGLVAHVRRGQSLCHYCHVRVPTPDVCPNVSCGAKLAHLGLGTQRVEDVLAAQFPAARVARVDSDTMRHRDEYRRLVGDFANRAIDVLVGTQMIAKGLDFPFVSFVGVVHADAAALAADFRAQERLFQLITQVAGRAGRADAVGQVVVQTTAPELPALQFALRHDYESFVNEELTIRRRVGLPPFRRLARIILSHAGDAAARAEGQALAERITDTIGRMGMAYADVLGPNPCALTRLRGLYRYDLLIRTPTASALRDLMRELDQSRALRTRVDSMVIDVDPVSMT